MIRALSLLSLMLLLGGVDAVQAQGSFDFFPDTISFGTLTVGQSASRSVTTYYFSGGDTNVSASSDNEAFTVSPSSQMVSSDGASFTVRFRPLTSGFHSGTITFSTESGGQSVLLGQVAVDGAGFAPFSLSATTLTFGPTLVGSSSTQALQIRVDPQVEFLDLTVQSSNPAVFSVTPDQFSPLEAGETGVVTVTFTPNAAGEVRAAVRITGGGATVSVVVEGEGVAFLLSDTQLDLGGALAGCSTSREFTLVTGGLFDFQIVPTTQDLPFAAEPSSFSTDTTTEVAALFNPIVAGTVQGVLRIFARSDGRIVQSQDLPVTGVGTEPVPDPSSIDFGSVPTGTTSSPGSVVIMPNPPAAFPGVYSASSDNPAFQVVSTNTSGRVDVAFSPLSEGPANGIITVEVATQTNRECAVPVRVPVQGIGGPGLLTLSPTSFDFGMQPVGQTSLAREVLVTNESNISFTGTVSSDNPAFQVNPAIAGAVAQTAVSVPAGGSASVPIVFQPADLGIANGTITFEFSGTPAGSGEPITLTRTVTVRGEGAAANLSYVVVLAGTPADVSPGETVSFGPTSVGSTNSVEFSVSNEGTTPIPIDLISASDAPVFTADGSASPTSIEPGASLTFTLAFEPPAFSSYSGTLEIGSAVFLLEGSGVLGGAEISGVGDTIPANDQPGVGVRLSSPTTQQLSGVLTMTYTPAGGLQPDPSVQFETGGTSVSFTVGPDSDTAVFPNGETMIGFQSGTIAAGFVFVAALTSGELDITPTPAPASSGNVVGGPPAISRVTVESVTAAGFTVVVEGFSSTREITQATFNLTGRSGIEVQPASVTPSGIADAFQSWYQSEDSLAFGSMFTLTVPFTISGETNAIASVAATVSNSQGASQAVSANLP